MITKTDAIAICKAICNGLRNEQAKPALQGPDNRERYAARGMAAIAIESIYYALPEKTRADLRTEATRLGLSTGEQALFKLSGWPE